MSSPQRLILLVEDDVVSRTLTKEMLILQNYQILEALSLLKSHRPDLILADISMLGIDGIALIQQVRAQSQFALTMSGYRSLHNRQTALEAGADGYLKPIGLRQLFKEVKTVLDQNLIASPKNKE